MGKTTVSHRLDDDLLAWANSYAKTRGTTRSVLLEEGLRALQGLAEGGVPDLPVVDSPVVREQRAKQAASEPPYASVLGQRMNRLNRDKYGRDS